MALININVLLAKAQLIVYSEGEWVTRRRWWPGVLPVPERALCRRAGGADGGAGGARGGAAAAGGAAVLPHGALRRSHRRLQRAVPEAQGTLACW